jgi:hypothetical protein
MAGFSKVLPLSFAELIPLGSKLGLVELILISSVLSLLLLLAFLDQTDVPFIRNLPAVPGIPIFGNLWQLGNEHPKRLAELSRKYGPVFQIRLGNRVSHPSVRSFFFFFKKIISMVRLSLFSNSWIEVRRGQ